MLGQCSEPSWKKCWKSKHIFIQEIIAHGSFITELEEIFTEEYKINAEYIKTQNKLEKKKKN